MTVVFAIHFVHQHDLVTLNALVDAILKQLTDTVNAGKIGNLSVKPDSVVVIKVPSGR